MTRSSIKMPVVSSSGSIVNAEAAVLMSLPPDTWDGSAIDLTLYGSIVLDVLTAGGRVLQRCPVNSATDADWSDWKVTGRASGSVTTLAARDTYTGMAMGWFRWKPGTGSGDVTYLGAGS